MFAVSKTLKHWMSFGERNMNMRATIKFNTEQLHKALDICNAVFCCSDRMSHISYCS